MTARSRSAALVASALALAPAFACADELVVVSSLRAGITVNTLVLTPPAPAKATVILLPGGDGWLSVASGQPTRLTGNFLVRTRTALVGQGFRTVLVDAPSDRQNATGLTGGFRTTVDHARDLAGVVKHFVPDKYIPSPFRSSISRFAAEPRSVGPHPGRRGRHQRERGVGGAGRQPARRQDQQSERHGGCVDGGGDIRAGTRSTTWRWRRSNSRRSSSITSTTPAACRPTSMRPRPLTT